MSGHDAHLEIEKRKDGTWSWRLREGSEIIAVDGSPGYESRTECIETGEALVNGYYSSARIVLVAERDD